MNFTKVEIYEQTTFPMMGPGMWKPEHLYILFDQSETYIFTNAGWAPWKQGQSIREVLAEYNP
jgi:hypothetical protein